MKDQTRLIQMSNTNINKALDSRTHQISLNFKVLNK